MGNIVAIVGRPNVGKSTLFNRLIASKQSIIDNTPGVTRDRNYGICEWNGKAFTVIDTGGYVSGSDDIFESAIRDQVVTALEESQLIMFMVDAHTGITSSDEAVADILRKNKKRVFLVVNKVDSTARVSDAAEFWALGFDNLYEIAAVSGSGTGDLLDAITEALPEESEHLPDLPKFAIVGQPNAGKSSLTNALLGEERAIVTEIAGTTRDAVHSVYNKFGMEFILIDTAGIRKKSKVHEDLEFYSVLRAIQAMEEADICMIIIDAKAGVESQDLNIFRLAQKRNKGIVILINKWDLIDKETNTARDFEAEVKRRLAPFSDVPVVFISVLEKQRIFKAVEVAMEVYRRRTQKIKTSELNEFLQEALTRNQPPIYRGRQIKIKYMTQLPIHYPAFAIFCNHPDHINPAYKQYLENQLREKFDFTGVPISIFFREK
jgi:GTP-binding protein